MTGMVDALREARSGSPTDLPYERQLAVGETFILGATEGVPAIFGRDHDVLWAAGESLMIAGPQGVGKTTLMQQIALRRAGVLTGDLIGYPIEADTEKITLYLAVDRPQQIARSFRRMVSDSHTGRFERLAVWRGPLPFDLVKQPERLARFCHKIATIIGRPVGTVFIDSLKDIATPLSSDEVGGAVSRAIGALIAEDINVCNSHHQRKATSENKRPTSLSDVYGSTWLTAGSGSVLLLWGEPGDPLVTLTHLKQPAEEVGPLELAHDHARGVTTRCEQRDAWTLLRIAAATGITASDVARSLQSGEPTRAQIEKQRRKLEKLVGEGVATRVESPKAGEPTIYRVTHRDPSRDPSRNGHDSHDLALQLVTDPHTPSVTAQHPLKGGGRDETVTPKGRTDEELQALIDTHKELV